MFASEFLLAIHTFCDCGWSKGASTLIYTRPRSCEQYRIFHFLFTVCMLEYTVDACVLFAMNPPHTTYPLPTVHTVHVPSYLHP